MNKSFTLIEILVVIVVIGIISSFIIVGLSSVSDKANIAKGQVFSNSLRSSLLMNLVSEWKLDGNANDSWGTNNGTWNGSGGGSYASPSWRTNSECVSGGCLAFDGTDDYVDCGNNDNLKNITDAITVSYWAYINAYPTSNYALFVSKGYPPISGGSWSPGLTNYGSGYFFIRSGDNSTYSYPDVGGWTKIPLKTWIYMTHVFNGINTYAATYQNGKIDKERSDVPFNTIYVSNHHVILGTGSASDRFFNGLIDDVRIYNQAIQNSQIQQNYFIGINKLYKNKRIVLSEFNQKVIKLKNNLANY